MDVSQSAVRKLRQRGRLTAKQYIKGRLEDTRGWLMPELTHNRHWFYHAELLEDYKNSEEYQALRQRGKDAIAKGLRKPR